MNLPLEEYIPYRILALIVLAVFYGIYLVKQWRQKRRGIQAMQIGRRKEAQTHTVETLMGIATVGIIPAQLLSITFGWSHLPANARFTGFCFHSVHLAKKLGYEFDHAYTAYEVAAEARTHSQFE